jgi:anti-sigma regulatory factor (Ser/Thr protein kinase)
MLASETKEHSELARLPVTRIQDVLLSRMVAREQGTRLGFSPSAVTQIATAMSEVTRNVVQHAGSGGQVRIVEITQAARRGLKIVVEDSGVGIRDLDRVLGGTSPGAGIPGCRRIMDQFEIRSTSRTGTTVTMVKWLPNESNRF